MGKGVTRKGVPTTETQTDRRQSGQRRQPSSDKTQRQTKRCAELSPALEPPPRYIARFHFVRVTLVHSHWVAAAQVAAR